jgi:CO/xanthine dehydrogenase Mo-binding subunit
VKLPGMLTAVVLHPPRFGGKLKSFDAAKAKAVPGVREVVAFSDAGHRRRRRARRRLLDREERPRRAHRRVGRQRRF